MINVLIAEDNVHLSVTISNAINITNEVRVVSMITEGQDVYPAIKSNKPDVIILDLKLPGEDGLSILKKIQDDKELKNMKVLVYSGEQAYIQKITSFSCVERFFDKAHSREELVMEIKRIAREKEEKNLGNKIMDMLLYLGFAPRYNGTEFLKECIEISLKYKVKKLNVMYEMVSKGKVQTASSIKSEIQRATDEMWKLGDREKVRKFLRLGDKEIPSPKNIVPMIKYRIEKK